MFHVSSSDGTSISYVRSGTGPALLLVHGTTADHRRWAAVAPRLEQHFTVYAMDRRGRGGSTDSPDYHILREADDVAAVTVGFGSLKRRLASPSGTVERCTVEISGRVAA